MFTRNPQNRNLNKRILSLAIPNIISNLSVPMLSAVDTALMGRLENEQYLGAIAIGGIIFGFVYWGFSFLRMGVTGLTAQAYGARDSEESTLILKRALIVALLSALLLLLFQPLIAALSFYLMDAGPEVERLARSYFHIRICAAPATLTLHVFHGWFLGMQNAKYPMPPHHRGESVEPWVEFLFCEGSDDDFRWGCPWNGDCPVSWFVMHGWPIFEEI